MMLNVIRPSNSTPHIKDMYMASWGFVGYITTSGTRVDILVSDFDMLFCKYLKDKHIVLSKCLKCRHEISEECAEFLIDNNMFDEEDDSFRKHFYFFPPMSEEYEVFKKMRFG